MWHVWIKTEMLTGLWFETPKATDHLKRDYNVDYFKMFRLLFINQLHNI